MWTLWYTVGGDRVAYRDGSTVTWIYGDQVGSTTLTRTEFGANKRQRYTPWGELRTNANLSTDRHYTGQIADLSTGLAFYNARYYDPVVGQFTAADTIVANPTDGQNLNRYSYVLNNPVNYSDPTGNCAEFAHPESRVLCFEYGQAEREGIPYGWWLVDDDPGPPGCDTTDSCSFVVTLLPGYDCADVIESGAGVGNSVFCVLDFVPAVGKVDEAVSVVNKLFRKVFPGSRKAPNASRLCSFSAETEVLMAAGTTKGLSG